MPAVAQWVAHASQWLNVVGVEASRLEAQLLAAHFLGKERSEVLAHPEWLVPPEADELLRRRLAGEPLAYILGYREFYGRRFAVNKRVLIPRQETETIIEAWFQSEDRLSRDVRVLDLGTGSGCIGITLALERPELQVTLSDISGEALKVAKSNAESLGGRVELIRSDLFDRIPDKYDAIVSNPPYVGSQEELPKEVREFEPTSALYAGPEGLDIYRRIAADAREHLNENGLLFLEMGYSQSKTVPALFDAHAWKLERVFKDLTGIDRVLVLARDRHGRPSRPNISPLPFSSAP